MATINKIGNQLIIIVLQMLQIRKTEMRNIKSEGGWGVVFTEQVEMHHTSEITPYIELRLWDDRDIKIVSKMADKIHNYDTPYEFLKILKKTHATPYTFFQN